MAKRLTYSKTKPEPRVLKCSSALSSSAIAWRKSKDWTELMRTDGV